MANTRAAPGALADLAATPQRILAELRTAIAVAEGIRDLVLEVVYGVLQRVAAEPVTPRSSAVTPSPSTSLLLPLLPPPLDIGMSSPESEQPEPPLPPPAVPFSSPPSSQFPSPPPPPPPPFTSPLPPRLSLSPPQLARLRAMTTETMGSAEAATEAEAASVQPSLPPPPLPSAAADALSHAAGDSTAGINAATYAKEATSEAAAAPAELAGEHPPAPAQDVSMAAAAGSGRTSPAAV
ncbi:unnamed protein product [Phaeothamnion confervicola]